MHQISRILVPVDFSDCSRRALDYAIFLARQFNAHIDILHVWHLPEVVRGDLMVLNKDAPGATLEGYMAEQAERALDEFLAELGKEAHVSRQHHLRTGDPASTIVKEATEGEYDLVVMGTHGRVGLSHVLLGSVAEKVVRLAPCPVVTFRAAEEKR